MDTRRECFVTIVFLLVLLAGGLAAAEYTVRLLNLAVISAIAVLGLNFAFGWSGLITLAQGAFVGFGAYSSALLCTRLGLDPWTSSAIAVVAAAAFALIGVPMLRLSGHYLALATLGLNVSFEIVTSNWVAVTGGSNGIAKVPSYSLHGMRLDGEHAFFPLGWLVLTVLAFAAYGIRSSRLGRAMLALRDDEIATKMSGVGTVGLKTTVFVICAVYAAISGALFAHHSKFISPGDFGYVHSIFFLAMLIVGGEGSILGAILGAILVTFLPEWLRPLGDGYLTAFGVLLLLVLVFMPKGLMSLIPSSAQRGRVAVGRASAPSAR
jgi:branched-chain amino acid transport system permease protein